MIKDKNKDTLDKYVLDGKYLFSTNPTRLGGEISIDKDGLITEGLGGESNSAQELKGIAICLEGTVTLLMVEWPIRKDASNVVYALEKMPNQKTLGFNGKYTGYIYKDVKVEIPDDEETQEMQLGEALLSVDFNKDKSIYIRMDLEKNKQRKVKAA